MLRMYIGELDKDHEAGNAIIIASSAKEAKKLAFSYFQDEDPEWTDVSVKWKRNANIDGLEPGIQHDWIELIRRDIISNCLGFPCPICGVDALTTIGV